MSDILTFNTEEQQSNITLRKPFTFSLVLSTDPILREVMPEFDFANPPVNPNQFASSLVETCKAHKGLGLSANQCGIMQRVFVIGTEHFQFACINPKVVAQSEEISKDNEGCLSFPAMHLKIPRPIWCDVEFYEENGALKQIRLEGLTARCFLHELDHMNGIKFIEHAGPLAVQMARQRQEKLVKNVFLGRRKTIARKVEEILLTWLMERRGLVSKSRLLEVYLNVIEWGPGIFGVTEASRFYFHKILSISIWANVLSSRASFRCQKKCGGFWIPMVVFAETMVTLVH